MSFQQNQYIAQCGTDRHPPAPFSQQIIVKHILCTRPVQDTGDKKHRQGLCPNGAKSRERNSPAIAPVKYRGVRGTRLGHWPGPGAGGQGGFV